MQNLPITKDNVIMYGGSLCYSIEEYPQPHGPKDNIYCREPCGLNSSGLHIASIRGFGHRKVQSFRLVSECYSSVKAAKAALETQEK